MIVKISVDLAMTAAMMLLMTYLLIGEETHEWIGIVMFVLFVTHHWLNRAWSRNILRGKYHVHRFCQTMIVFLILLCMLGSMISGMILSQYVFAALNIHKGMEWARTIHMLCAYWGYVLMGLHLGFHWNMMLSMAGKTPLKAVTGKTVTMRVLAVLMAFYGGIAFIKRDIWNYMILRNHFAFFDFSEPVIFFLLDYLAVLGLFVFVGHYMSRGLISLKKRQKI